MINTLNTMYYFEHTARDMSNLLVIILRKEKVFTKLMSSFLVLLSIISSLFVGLFLSQMQSVCAFLFGPYFLLMTYPHGFAWGVMGQVWRTREYSERLLQPLTEVYSRSFG